MFFREIHKDKNSKARVGEIKTSRGIIKTPAFMPVGTQATVKCLDLEDLREIGCDIILNNTYHLHLRPGEDLICEFGGVHAFQGWKKPILTDSGGFQVFSLAESKKSLVKIDENGVDFKSHIDGSKHRFTPEIALDIQKKLGADIIMAFDQCTTDNALYKDAKSAMEKTHVWAKRCSDEMKKPSYHDWNQYLFGIIQGGIYEDLRRESAEFICNLNFDGIAIGGESIGYNMLKTREILGWIYEILPKEKPRYAMGVGASILDILDVVEYGIDMFDCVAPTRMARNGTVFASESKIAKKYRISITNSEFRKDSRPISAWCKCKYCKGEFAVSRRYIHHLFRVNEMLGARIASYHNLFFLEQFMTELRDAILEHGFIGFSNKWRNNF